MRPATLRTQLEAVLGERVSSPFTDLDKRVWERLLTSIAPLDAATGGLPRGAITEIFGLPSSGRTSIALSILAAASHQGESCALIDGKNAFDPESGATAGIDMRRLLWVRCRNLDQSLQSTDLLLQGGGFGLIVLDLSDLPRKAIHGVSLASWFRFQRTIENTPTVLALIGCESIAKSAAALVLRTERKHVHWSGVPGPSHGILMSCNRLEVEVVRARANPKSEFRNPKFLHDVRGYSRS